VGPITLSKKNFYSTDSEYYRPRQFEGKTQCAEMSNHCPGHLHAVNGCENHHSKRRTSQYCSCVDDVTSTSHRRHFTYIPPKVRDPAPICTAYHRGSATPKGAISDQTGVHQLGRRRKQISRNVIGTGCPWLTRKIAWTAMHGCSVLSGYHRSDVQWIGEAVMEDPGMTLGCDSRETALMHQSEYALWHRDSMVWCSNGELSIWRRSGDRTETTIRILHQWRSPIDKDRREARIEC
jgi:hypothetical protein